MGDRKIIYILIAGLALCTAMCRKPYEPPVTMESNHFLAVDGFINTGTNAVSKFTLTRSISLSDSIPILPELLAQVQIQSANGSLVWLVDSGNNGIYLSPPLNLDPAQQYRLSVNTSDGNQYLSDYVTPKNSAPIDSLTWELSNDAAAGNEVVKIYVSTHDETNNTRYYRWDYEETWQHRAAIETFWILRNGLEELVPAEESTYTCWTTGNSSSIILGSSINLSSDVISHALVTSFVKNDPKLDIRYSMLIRQIPMDLEAYSYWLSVQKNSQSLGGLFDVQPSQIRGNFHSVTHPNDPAVGYVSACSTKEFRMFISNTDLPGWKSNPVFNCPISTVESNPEDPLRWIYPDPDYQLWYYAGGPPPLMLITYKKCLDCRLQGGTNVKPPFWQ